MKIINALLLSALYLILVAPTSAAEFTVSGMIHKTTCSIDDSTSNTIKLPDVKVGLLKVGVPQSASSGGALSITVSCKDPDASMAFEGRFTTKGEVDPTTTALKISSPPSLAAPGHRGTNYRYCQQYRHRTECPREPRPSRPPPRRGQGDI